MKKMSKTKDLAMGLFPLWETDKIGNNPYISYNTEQLAKQEGFIRGYHQVKESEDKKIREEIARFIRMEVEDEIVGNKWLAWLKKQGEYDKIVEKAKSEKQRVLLTETNGNAGIDWDTRSLADTKMLLEYGLNFINKKLEKQGKKELVNFDEVEKEKSDFVGDGFIRCFANFLDFKEGETYWLEYIGDDNYNVRSDNLLGKTYHITPCQLYTVFKKLTWLEKQGEQKQDPCDNCKDVILNCHNFPCIKKRAFEQGKSTLEVINEEKVDNQNCVKPVDKVEPKFKVGDWIIGRATNNEPRQISEITGQYYKSTYGGQYGFSYEDEMHLWTIQDAKDGDVLVTHSGIVFIFENIMEGGTISFYVALSTSNFASNTKIHIPNDNEQLCDQEVFPATKEQRDTLFAKMKESGYEWDAEKKNLKKIEQKTADKVEPKFKVGDWIVSNVSHEDYRICKILNIKNGEYIIESIYGYQGHNNFETFDKDYHLWAIQDAKDGDVLVNWNNTIYLFKGIEEEVVKFYCYYNTNREEFNTPFDNDSHLGLTEPQFEHHPATKEQRDLLFQKMKEAGYEWDAEKKELKIIDWSKHIKYEPNSPSITKEYPTWNEDDELYIKELESLVKKVWATAERENDKDKIHKMSNLSFFLKTLKPQSKQEWSEEDERNFKCIMKIIKEKAFADYDVDENNNMLGIYRILEIWLKSLRPNKQWKPSDRDIKLLRELSDGKICPDNYRARLHEIINNLKQL